MNDNVGLLLLQIEKAWRDLTDAYAQYLLSGETKSQSEGNLKLNEDSYRNRLTTLADLFQGEHDAL